MVDQLDKEDDKSQADLGIYDDLKRLGKTCGLIFRFWTSPMTDMPSGLLHTKEDRESFRLSAVAIIAFLFFALRPDLKDQLGPAFVGLGLTVCIAFCADFLMAYRIRITEQFVMGSYSFMACTMLVFLCFLYGELPFSLNTDSITAEYICHYTGSPAPVGGELCAAAKPIYYGFFTFLACAPFLAIKSIFLDKNKTEKISIAWKSIVLSLVFVGLTVLIYGLPAWLFEGSQLPVS